MTDELEKYIRYNERQFQMVNHMELAFVANSYKEAYKNSRFNNQQKYNSLEMKIDFLTDKINTLNNIIEKKDDYENKYITLKNRKLTWKERLFGRHIEK